MEAIQRAKNPERLIVGTDNGCLPEESYFHSWLEVFSCPILSMKYESAELAKISINMFLMSTLLTANSLSRIGAELGADWDDIIPTLQTDRRIGPYSYLKSGLGFNGGNLERDLKTVVGLAEKYGYSNSLFDNWQETNNSHRLWVQETLDGIKASINHKDAALLGLSYKENTDSIKTISLGSRLR